MFQEVTNTHLQILSPSVLLGFFHTSWWVSQMVTPICPVLRAAIALAYKYLGFIVSLVPGCLEVSLCCSDPDTVILRWSSNFQIPHVLKEAQWIAS